MDREIFIKKYLITNTEEKLLESLIKGLSDDEIALMTSKSKEKIQTETSKLLRKLNSENVIKASIKSIKEGFI